MAGAISLSRGYWNPILHVESYPYCLIELRMLSVKKFKPHFDCSWFLASTLRQGSGRDRKHITRFRRKNKCIKWPHAGIDKTNEKVIGWVWCRLGWAWGGGQTFSFEEWVVSTCNSTAKCKPVFYCQLMLGLVKLLWHFNCVHSKNLAWRSSSTKYTTFRNVTESSQSSITTVFLDGNLKVENGYCIKVNTDSLITDVNCNI